MTLVTVRPSAVQATGANVATVGQEACLLHSEKGQSVVPGRGKVAHQPSHRQVVCKAEQAKGRHPDLVTRALVLWSSLRTHRLRDKGVGGRITSAGTSSPGALPKKSTPATTPVAQSVSRLPGTGGRPPYCRPVPFRALALMRYQKRRCSPPPSPHRQVVVGRGRAGTEVRRAWSYLLRCRGKRRQGRDRSAPKLRHGPECVSLGVSSTWVSATLRNSAITSVSSPSSLFRWEPSTQRTFHFIGELLVSGTVIRVSVRLGWVSTIVIFIWTVMNTTRVAILAVSSGGGSMNMHSASSIGWQTRIEEDRATHFVVISRFKDETIVEKSI